MNFPMILAAALTVGACDARAFIPITIVAGDTAAQQASLTPASPSNGHGASPANPHHRAVTFRGKVEGDVSAPRVGIYRITGDLNFEKRVEASMRELSTRPPVFEKVVDVDGDGSYTITVEERGEDAVAFILVGWDDRDGDRRYNGAVAGLTPEGSPNQYLYWRTPRTSGFTLGFMWQKALPQYADFLF